jgi:GDP-4-dehydro-6-deoxy-D-mannose reductase
MTTALVTGSHGFVGNHLRAELHRRGWTVIGLGRSDRVAEAAATGERYIRADLTDAAGVAAALDTVRPDVVFHLAATPAYKLGGDVTALVGDAVHGTFTLCAALRAAGQRPRFVQAGSSAQYGALSRQENPVDERARCNPVTAYGFAKAAAEATVAAFGVAGCFDVIPVRAFNHVGPGEPTTTVASSFAARIIEVLAGRAESLRVQDLDAVRDFTDVRDIVRGYVDLAERGENGRLYNLCSGHAVTVGEVLDGLLRAAGLSRSVVEVEPSSGLAERPGSIPYQVGSAARVAAEVGWRPSIGLDQSLRDLLARVQQDVVR